MCGWGVGGGGFGGEGIRLVDSWWRVSDVRPFRRPLAAAAALCSYAASCRDIAPHPPARVREPHQALAELGRAEVDAFLHGAFPGLVFGALVLRAVPTRYEGPRCRSYPMSHGIPVPCGRGIPCIQRGSAVGHLRRPSPFAAMGRKCRRPVAFQPAALVRAGVGTAAAAARRDEPAVCV